MFGFGKSALEKAMIERVKSALRPLGLEGHAENIVTQSKEETLKMVPDLAVINWGDVMAQSPSYVTARNRFQISEQDIRNYWNAGIFLRVTDSNLRNFMNVLKMEMLRIQGNLNIDQVGAIHVRTCPVYGNPDAQNSSLKNGESNLPSELEERVAAWELKTDQQTKDELLKIHPSFNAMVESLIAEGKL